MISLDRNRGGVGVCTYIRSCMNYTRRLDLEIQFLEMLALKIPKTSFECTEIKPFRVFISLLYCQTVTEMSTKQPALTKFTVKFLSWLRH